VEECARELGARPVEWLLANMPVDFRWTLVHATHLTPAETVGIAASGATVALCPTTEANLGDGLFPLADYLQAGGRWGIGSDSHISVSLVEELRWLEYGQRLRAQRRNIAVQPGRESTGECLWANALAGGAIASQRSIGGLEPATAATGGTRADLLVLDDSAPELAARDAGNVLDSWLFSGNRNLVRDVYVGGRHVVHRGAHADQQRIAARYHKTVEALR
jgi:formimidoylglutamate deiminase